MYFLLDNDTTSYGIRGRLLKALVVFDTLFRARDVFGSGGGLGRVLDLMQFFYVREFWKFVNAGSK